MQSLSRYIPVFLILFSVNASATALNINLPIGSCPSGSVMAAGGACGALPNLNDQVAPVVVTAPRLDANGNPISGVNNSYHTPTTSTPGYVPSGWTNTGSALTPPASVPADNLWSYTNGANVTRSSSSPSATCTAILGDNPGKEFQSITDYDSTHKYCNMWTSSAHTGTASALMALSYSCTAGRTLSGSNCNTSNAAQVPRPSDGHCNIIQNGSTFSGDPSDPDCSAATQGASLGTSGLTVAAQGGSVSVTPNTDGSSKVTINTTNTDNSTSTTTTINISGGGQATGVSQGQSAGTGTAATTPAPSSGSGTAPIDVSGLNKEATQGQIKTGIDQLHADLNPTGVDTSLSTQKTALDSTMENLKSAVTNAPSDAASAVVGIWDWGFSLPSCGCEPLSIDYHGSHAEFNWCPYMAKFADALGYVLYVMTAMGLLAILTRRI